MSVEGQRPPYTESQVIMTTVKVVSPFVFTYGLFVTFHGSSSPGGGFQGGAIVAAVFLMIAFAFGIGATHRWIRNDALVGALVVGVAVFAGIGLGAIALGGAFLEYHRYPIHHAGKWGMEAVEIGGIGFIVASALTGLFFLLASGYVREEVEAETNAETGADVESGAGMGADAELDTDGGAQPDTNSGAQPEVDGER